MSTFGVLVLVAVLGQAGVAWAGWSQPVRLAAGATYPVVGLDGRGDAVAVWMEGSSGGGVDMIFASQRLASTGVWGSPAALSPSGRFGGFPQLAVDPSGAIVAVWQEGGISQGNTKPGLPFIDASFKRSPTGPWSRTVRISARGVASQDPEVAINARGHAVAIWDVGTRETSSIQVSTVNVARGRWSAPVVLQTGRKLAIFPQVAINDSGAMFAVWRRYLRCVGCGGLGQGGTQWSTGAAVKPARRRSWLTRSNLGTEDEYSLQGDTLPFQPGPHLAADHHGDAIAVWQGGSVSNQVTDFAVWKATRGAWSNPGAIPKGAGDWPQVAASPAGDATVVWAGGSGVRAISRPISGCCWSVPQTIGLSGANLQVVVDRAGDALVSSDQGSPEVSFRPGPTGVWGPPAAVSSSSGFSTHTAMTALGQAVAVWLQQGNLEAATYSGGN